MKQKHVNLKVLFTGGFLKKNFRNDKSTLELSSQVKGRRG